MVQDEQCNRCCAAPETELHIFFECPYAKKIWRASGISNLIINNSNSSLEDKIEACLQCSLSTRLSHFQDLPFWLLWRIWKSRNTLLFQQKDIHWRTLLRYAQEDAIEWKKIEKNESRHDYRHPRISSGPPRLHWTRPQAGWVKCNTDGSFHQAQENSNAGWVVRDENGVYKGAAQAKGRRSHDALECELQAILLAIQHCWSMGYRKLILESDCQKEIDILTNKRRHFGYYNWQREINWWAMRFQDIRFTWTHRSANKVADSLAKHIEDGVSFCYLFYVPQYLNNLLHCDHIHSC